MAARQRQASAVGRDIGEIPACVNPEAAERSKTDFRFFCETYFPHTFALPWSPDHLRVLGKLQQAVLTGGLFALAMPRGSGKTSICECACIWIALTTGAYVALVGSDEGHATVMLASIKTEFEENDRLLADFPGAVMPIHALDGIAQRAVGQLYTRDGESKRTHIEWTGGKIVLPTIPGSPASGAVIEARGITGRIRGMKHKRPDGVSIRPTLVIVDDPQTDESAKSPSQCASREAVLAGAILGLPAPGKKLAGIMPCTVIMPDDMADNILNRTKHPDWQGERFSMVYDWPADTKRWEKYGRLRAESLRADGDGHEATDFYRANRAAMDEGSRVAWAERFNCDELSAIQHAMNLRLRNERTFMAEYQNAPLPAAELQQEELTVDSIAKKLSGFDRGVIPSNAAYLTAFIDVHDRLLYWIVTAWSPTFTGWIVDYGTYPDQHADYFKLSIARRTLRMVAPKIGREGAIAAGLEKLTAELFQREWKREDGSIQRLNRCHIDAAYEAELIYDFCRRSIYAPLLMPARGRFIGASHIPFSQYRPERGTLRGFHWRVLSGKGRPVRYVEVDVNWYKSFIYRGFLTSFGDCGCLSLFGKKPDPHRLLGDHVVAQYRVRTEARGNIVDEWRVRPTQGDDHWLDGLVGAAVAGSMLGATILPSPAGPPTGTRPRRPRVATPI